MKENRMLDSNKVLWHMDRVIAHFDKGEMIAPVHIDCGLTKYCDISCRFCFGRFQNAKHEYIQRDALLQFTKDASEVGVRSLAAIGDGEPILNPAVYEFLSLGKKLGISMAISTNAVTLDTEEKAKTVLESCEWMRVCICAGDREGYIRNHAVDKFDKVKENIARLVNLKIKNGYECDLGLQAVYAPDGEMDDDMIKESKLAVELGVDYLTIKQCSLPEGNLKVNKVSFDVNNYDTGHVHSVLIECENYSTEKTKIIPKWDTMARKGARLYKHCPAMPILSEMSGNGDFFGCGYFFGNKPQYDKFKFGNIHETRFKDIVKSDRYWDIIKHFREEFNSHTECAGSCRLDSCNQFLSEYLNKPRVINFI